MFLEGPPSGHEIMLTLPLCKSENKNRLSAEELKYLHIFVPQLLPSYGWTIAQNKLT